MSATDEQATRGLSLPTLTAMVVGSMIGAGVFSLPARFGEATGVVGTVIGWSIAGFGILMLAYVFQNLAVRRPELDAGIFAYAKAGFGDYVGFNAAFGYWASVCAGNAFYWVFIMTTLSAVFPALGEGDTALAVGAASLAVWTFCILVLRGVREAAALNRIVTIAKVIPIVMFVVLLVFAFDVQAFTANFWGGERGDIGDVARQVGDTMIVTTFVFLGIEGASMYSRFARRREDVGRATVVGFLSVLALFALVTLTSYGVLPQRDLASTPQPSMAGVLEVVVGPWGEALISVGVIVAVLGAYLAWTLMAAEVLFIPARSGDMPRFLAAERNGTPTAALWFASGFVQLLLLATLLADDALNVMLELCTSLALIPYLLAAAYAVKISLAPQPGDRPRGRRSELVVGVLAMLYTTVLIAVAGLAYLLVTCIIYAPGVLLYVRGRRERRQRVFTRSSSSGPSSG
ncbi:basic amino acid/polyamine antiporter [Aeromicrobium camelliae]|uniref:basic amino acid/polyamine antiporter n=1 Tax=Aeromicrobium camelliae TaxID=1538144 RepID=UPI001AA0394D|nr:basic amino acid/polyamine antiporter [Aeromicrobium camelliae]